jgi:hypothetical protein
MLQDVMDVVASNVEQVKILTGGFSIGLFAGIKLEFEQVEGWRLCEESPSELLRLRSLASVIVFPLELTDVLPANQSPRT